MECFLVPNFCSNSSLFFLPSQIFRRTLESSHNLTNSRQLMQANLSYLFIYCAYLIICSLLGLSHCLFPFCAFLMNCMLFCLSHYLFIFCEFSCCVHLIICQSFCLSHNMFIYCNYFNIFCLLCL